MIKITHFDYRMHKYGHHKEFSFDELVNYIEEHSLKQFDGQKEDIKQQLPGFIGSYCSDKRRQLTSLPKSTLMVLDFDCKANCVVNPDRLFRKFEGYARILYFTASSTIKIPRYRLIFPLSKKMTSQEDHRAMVRYFVTKNFSDNEIKAIDRASMNMVAVWSLPCNGASVRARNGRNYVPFIPPPDPIPEYKGVCELSYDSKGREKAKNYVIETIKRIRNQLHLTTSKGNRNETINGAAYSLGRLIPSGMLTEVEAKSIIVQSPCFQSLARDEGISSADKSMMSGIKRGALRGKIL